MSLARSLFQEQMSLERLVTTIIREAKDLLKCERCTFYLLDLKMYDAVSSAESHQDCCRRRLMQMVKLNPFA